MSDHWDTAYARPPETLTWYQEEPRLSIAMISAAVAPPASVLDVGGGASLLVDRLLVRGFSVGVLDIAESPLQQVRSRLGVAAAGVEWFVDDVTRFRSPHPWNVWHDRAVLHFLAAESQRRAYVETLLDATAPQSSAIIAAFGPEGPERCSGLPVVRYSPDELARTVGSRFALRQTEWETHRTPAGVAQQFVYCRFLRIR